MIRVITAAVENWPWIRLSGTLGSSRGRESSSCAVAVNIVLQLVGSTDTIPGEISAVVINKRGPPRWSPADLKEIRVHAIAALSSPKAGEPVFLPRE